MATNPTAVSSSDLTEKHPLYCEFSVKWERCYDVLGGQDAVKSRDCGHRYLPPTAGMQLDGMCQGELGWCNYQAYLNRALFYGYYNEGVDLALGMLWNKPPVIEGLKGTPLEYLETRATHEGESLERLLYRINEAQISTGRIGIMADLKAGENVGQPRPYISLYSALTITNWDAGFTGELAQETLNMVVLDESGPRRQAENIFSWEDYNQYRVLMLGAAGTNEQSGVYQQGVFGTDEGAPDFDPSKMFTPNILGRPLNEIPFVFIHANSTTSCPQDPPMLSLADLVLHLYRLQADYSAELHGQTSATLVTKGMVRDPKEAKKPIRIGVGGHVDLGSSKEAEAYFLELSGKGLPEMRSAVADAKQLARERSGEIVDQSSRGRESGNSLEQRISVRTATLHSIAQHGAEGLQKLLKIMARWMGMSDGQVAAIKVKANTVFSKSKISGVDFKALTEASLLGGVVIPLSAMHNWLIANGFTDQTFEQFKEQWEAEKELRKEIQQQIAEGELMKQPPEPTDGPAVKGPAKVVPRPASTGV